MTEHQLFLWPLIWIDGLSPFCCTKIPSLRRDLARHEGCLPKSLNYVLAHEWDPVGFARNQVYRTLMKTRPKAKGIWK
jgi:hypothetical protein